jgi:hypothetical protein
MFTKTTFVLAIIVGTASGALAASKQHGTPVDHAVYDARGMYLGADPDANVRFELRRDPVRGRY